METVTKNDPKPIIIQIRYSLFNKYKAKNWRISRQYFESRKKQLFAPARLSLRERLFRSVTIPSLQSLYKGASGQYLRVLVYTSADLPQPFLSNLQLLVNELGCAEVLTFKEDEKFGYSDAISRVLCSMVDISELQQTKLTFAAVRLDDDDALSTDYIERLSQFILEPYSGFAITFGRGYVGRFDQKSQRFVMIDDIYKPMGSQGLAAICTYDTIKKTFCSPCSSAFQLGAHTTVDRRFPTIVDAQKPGFFASEHIQQDTTQRSLLQNLKQLARQMPLRKHSIMANEINKLRQNPEFIQHFGYIPLID